MNTELKKLLKKYRITQPKISEVLGCSQGIVSMVLNGKASDNKGIIDFCTLAIENAQKIEKEQKRKISELSAAAA